MDKPDGINWAGLESEMLRLATEDVARFAKQFGNETYYGFFLDCNAEYGEVLLCFNSIEALEYSAHNVSDAELRNREFFRQMDISNYKEMCEEVGDEYRNIFTNPADHPREYDDDPDSRRERLRWSPGDWKYQGFNSPAWEEKTWKRLSSQVCDALLDAEFDDEEIEESYSSQIVEQFMQTACRVLIELERTNAFACIDTTSNFECRCADHDEVEDEAMDRLAKVRAESLQ